MATREELTLRIRAFVEQLHSELGEFSASEEECWLLALEDMTTEVGDAVATALFEKQSESRAKNAEAACPKCGKPSHYRGVRKRQLIGRRGPVTISEPEFHCPCCRKAFFPDDGSDRG
jgi:hypothetical protein